MAFVIIIVTLGMFTRSSFMPAKDGFIATYSGDTLWAMMIYIGIAAIATKLSPLKVALYALSFSFTIEFSQLIQTDWLNNLRSHWLVALVLGKGYLASDLLCYFIGVLCPFIVETLRCNNKPRSA